MNINCVSHLVVINVVKISALYFLFWCCSHLQVLHCLRFGFLNTFVVFLLILCVSLSLHSILNSLQKEETAWAPHDCKCISCSPQYQKFGICTLIGLLKQRQDIFFSPLTGLQVFEACWSYFRTVAEFGSNFHLLSFWFCLVLIYICDECLFSPRWKVKPVNFMMIASYPPLWQIQMR